MKIFLVILVVVLGAGVIGCGASESASTTQVARSSEEAEPSEDREGPPTLSDRNDPRFGTVSIEGRGKPSVHPADLPPPKELLVRDLRVGSGPRAEWGDLAVLRYHGVKYETGEVWFRGWNYPPSLELRIGAGGAGQSFEEGIVGMQAGGRRELIIPGPLAVGLEPLDYVVELVRLEPATGGNHPTTLDPRFASVSFPGGERAKPRVVPPDLPPPKRMLVRDIEVGTGPIADRGDVVAVWYVGVFYKGGGEKYGGWWPAAPYSFELGVGGTGAAFEEGIEGMRVGGRREIVIPRHRMEGGAPIDYVVELVRLEPAAGGS